MGPLHGLDHNFGRVTRRVSEGLLQVNTRPSLTLRVTMQAMPAFDELTIKPVERLPRVAQTLAELAFAPPWVDIGLCLRHGRERNKTELRENLNDATKSTKPNTPGPVLVCWSSEF